MRPAARIARAAGAALALALVPAACNGGKPIILGSISPIPYHFAVPQLVAELASDSRTDNPTLTADLLEIYFTSDRGGNADVWFATRASSGAPFGTPAPVTAVNGDSFETSSAISADGLTLWFGSDRAGGSGDVDVWVSERPSRTGEWSTPVNVVALNSAAADIPRPVGFHERVMPMASTKMGPQNPNSGNYQTYLAARAAPGAPFDQPVAIPELSNPDSSTVDGFLTDDGLTLFYSSAPLLPQTDGGADGATKDGGTPRDAAAPDSGAPAVAKSDLFVAWRRSTSEKFSAKQPLTDLNTPADERDPWLSPDGTTLYFTSDRSGVLNIYTAQVLPRW
jgi:hypothetical protein